MLGHAGIIFRLRICQSGIPVFEPSGQTASSWTRCEGLSGPLLSLLRPQTGGTGQEIADAVDGTERVRLH